MKHIVRRFLHSLFGLVLLTGSMAHADLFISEIMPSNARVLADEDGDFPDWIEIHNTGPASENLQGWYLTDEASVLIKWAFPSVTVPPGGYLVVFASGKNRKNDPAHLHTNFELEANGEYLALVRPDGVTVVSAFTPTYPAVKEDISYGVAQRSFTTSLLTDSVPRILVPAQAADLPANWAARTFALGAAWSAGFAPPALGFDTNQPAAAPQNLAPGGTALQSTTTGAQTANRAINNVGTDYTQTLNTDHAPFWQVTLASDAAIDRIVLRNRTTCCGSRLRDITVEILSDGGTTTNFTSVLLNPENAEFTYPNGPVAITNDLVVQTGGPVAGRIIRITRLADPDLSGSGGQGGAEEIATLSFAEVEVIGVALGGNTSEVNLARTGTPAPTATQSSVQSTFTANLGINGNLGDFTHTLGTDPNPTWTLNLGRRAVINSVTLHNRDACCGSRLRDITVEILDSSSNVIHTSALLNPENAGYAYPDGPDNLVVTLAPNPVVGQYVRVRRTIDPDLSGSGGQGNTDEAAVLSLGEVIVLGYDLNGYRPFIRTDLQSQMLGKNASAFVRLPFQTTTPTVFNALSLRMRYDDGAIIYLNGVEVARRNAPANAAWNATATASRDLAAGIAVEVVDLTAALGQLVSGVNVLAVQMLNVSADDGDLLLQPELIATEVRSTANVFLTSATPGAPNDTDFYISEVADTRFSRDRGFFTNAFTLEITSATPEAQIYYSFDSSEPGPGQGLLYTGPLTITNTTVVRARAYRDGWKPSDVDTQTYLFLADVIRQSPNWPANRIPPPYFPASWGINTVDYGMDPNVVSQYTMAEWYEALTQIPTISMVTEMPNLFDAATGIYANAFGHGEEWERPGSLELIDPNASPVSRFQENCGLRIRGGFSRNAEFRKHSFRVFFRREYGAPKLQYPLFDDDGATEFDTFDLRTSQNYSWPRESDATQGRQDTMVREVWCRETLGAMGQPYRRSRYYHLYVNGHYWGLYETDERPEAAFGESYLGGVKENYDVVKCGNRGTNPNFATEATDGNLIAWSNLWTMTRSVFTNSANSNYFRVLGRNADGTRNPAMPVMIDVDNLIDYMLEIFYSGDGDATLSAFLANNQPNNWFGMRDRSNPDRGFMFFNSDCEHTLGSPSSQVDRTGPFPNSNQGNFLYSNPQWMHEELMRNLEYRVLFSDHVQKHFFNGGALTFEQCTNRWWRKATQITKAIRAYSARWGDAVREPPYGEADWTNRIQFIATNWFPSRAGIVLGQLIADGLFPTIGAPSFGNYGGFVSSNFSLTMSQTNPAGTIYFTIDGTDPRVVGGAISGGAQVYASAIPIDGNAHVRARVRVGTNWSAAVEATFTTAQYFRDLAVTEILYNPPGAPGVDGDEFEFLELKNTGTNTLNLSGLSFSAGITFNFTNGTRLAPGAFFVLARNPAQFAARYPGVPVNGIYSGRLDNAGETVRLAHFIGGTVFSITYDDVAPWPLAADGHGFSIVPVNVALNRNSDNGQHWRASANSGGSPGADDPALNVAPVVVSEVVSHTAIGQDLVELYNPTTNAVNIGGWFLTDDASAPKKFRIPSGRSLPANGYMVFTEADFNPTPGLGTSFSFNAQGDDVYLFSGDANTNLTGYSQGFAFGAAPEGVSFGRYVISTGEEQFPLQIATTPGAANAGPKIGPVVLSEIQYHPASGEDAFVEVKNISAANVGLFDATSPTNGWRINGIDFQFPPNVTLPAGGLALVVESEPAAFRARYGVPAAVPVFGPYGGGLQDSGERLELQRPDPRGTNGWAWVTVDEVRYNDRAPWPVAADGSGPSLQRLQTAAYGNDPANWTAAVATPGGGYAGGEIPFIVTPPASQFVVAFQDASFSVAASGPGPLHYQWRFNGANLDGATESTLSLVNVLPLQGGRYSVVVFNAAGSVESAAAVLTVGIPAAIIAQPQSQNVRPGSNVVFAVAAISFSPMQFQWQKNGVNIPGATNTILPIPNAGLADEGLYRVLITDAIGPVLSQAARLLILIDPIILIHPVGQQVPMGGAAVLSVTVSNPATLPLGYQLRRAGARGPLIESYDYTQIFVIPNVTNLAAVNYDIIVTNFARSAGRQSLGAPIVAVADSDGDGIPDLAEPALGLNPSNPADGALDADGDGLSNAEEYLAGTDHLDASSYLKVDRLRVPGAALIEFTAVSNRTYSVQFAERLGGEWTKLASISARTNDSLQVVTDTNSVPARFYRLVTPAQP